MTTLEGDTGRLPPRTWRLLVLLLLAVASFSLFTVASRSATVAPIRADARLYFSYAWNLKHSGVFSSAAPQAGPGNQQPLVPDTFVSPGYPFFLSLVPGLEPSDAFVRKVSFLQAGMGVLSVLLAVLIARRFLPDWAALASGMLVVLSPHLAVMATNLLTESLFMMLVLASVLATMEAARRSGSVSAAIVAGLVLGICCLVRPTMELFAPAMLLLACCLPGLRAWRRSALIGFLAFGVALGPWMLRNHFTPTPPGQPDLAVSFIQHGSYPGFMYEDRPESHGFPYRFDPAAEEHSRDMHAALTDIASHFRNEPARYLGWYIIGKPIAFLSWDLINGFGDIYTYPPDRSPYLEDLKFAVSRALMLQLHWPLAILGVLGALLAWLPSRRSSAAVVSGRVVSATYLYVLGFHMLGSPFPRYSLPFQPLLFALAFLPVVMALGLARRTPRP